MNADPMVDYRTFAQALEYMNRELFAGELPAVLITLQRRSHALGYYHHEAFADRSRADERVSEIALNPDHFAHQTDAEILATLAHELAHLWQFTYGRPSRNGYHNAEWAGKMRAIGLEPKRADGKPGVTGQKMCHAITTGGRFDQAAARFLAGSRLQWQARAETAEETQKKEKKTASKTKFTCPSCGQNAWAKPGAALMCLPCQEVMVEEEQPDDD